MPDDYNVRSRITHADNSSRFCKAQARHLQNHKLHVPLLLSTNWAATPDAAGELAHIGSCAVEVVDHTDIILVIYWCDGGVRLCG